MENSDADYYCAYCATPLITDRQVLVPNNQIRPPDKKSEIAEFLNENSALFVILGVFGALSFYLMTLISKSADYQISLYINSSSSLSQSIITDISDPQIPTIIGNITSMGIVFPNPEIIPIDSIINIQLAILCSFLFFFFVLGIIIVEVAKLKTIGKWFLLFLMTILFSCVGIYLLNTYSGIFLVLFILICTFTAFILYFFGYQKLVKEIKVHSSLVEWLPLIEPFIWIITYGFIMCIVWLSNQFTSNDLSILIVKILVLCVMIGFFAGIVLVSVFFYVNTLQEIFTIVYQKIRLRGE